MSETWSSKLGTIYQKADIEALDKQHHLILKSLRKDQISTGCGCAECSSQEDLQWAVVNLGIFVCVRCASVHRGVGTHISKVKGLTGTYLWGPDEVEMMKKIGNKRAREIYCNYGGGGDNDCSKDMNYQYDESKIREMIIKKYGEKRWFNEKKYMEYMSGGNTSGNLNGTGTSKSITNSNTQTNLNQGGPSDAVTGNKVNTTNIDLLDLPVDSGPTGSQSQNTQPAQNKVWDFFEEMENETSLMDL